MKKTTDDQKRRIFYELLPEQFQGNQAVVQLFRTGSWPHPEYGKVEFSEENFSDMVGAFKAGEREPSLNYEHYPTIKPSPENSVAAAWVKDVYIAPDPKHPGAKGLFAKVELTERAKGFVDKKEYRFISGEWVDDYEGTGKMGLVGGALTNKPFIKGMAPIHALSEDAGKLAKELEDSGDQDAGGNAPPSAGADRSKSKQLTEEKPMDFKKVAVALGLPDTATEAEILSAIEKQGVEVKTLSEKVPAAGTVVLLAAEATQLKVDAAAGAAALKRLDEQEADHILSECVNKYKIPAAKKDEIKKSLTSPIKEVRDAMKEMLASLPEGTFGSTQEKGTPTGLGSASDSPTSIASVRAKALVEADKSGKLSEHEALAKVLSDDPVLFDNYRAAQYSGGKR